MKQDINITNINTLKKLRERFYELNHISYKYFQKAESIIDQKLRSIKESHYKLQVKLEDANARLHNAELALTIAKQRRIYDENGKSRPVNTSSERSAVSRARAGQKTTRQNLHIMDDILGQVNSYYYKYKPTFERTKDMSIHFSIKSVDYIHSVQRIFDEYIEAGKQNI